MKNISKEFRAWRDMRYRCTSPAKADSYRDRGIRVDEGWASNFKKFLHEVGPAPTAMHWLERIDNNRGYEPGNVCWATVKEQTRNRRTNRLLTHDGATAPVVVWAERTGIPATAIYARLDLGWDPTRILTTPPRNDRRRERATA